MIKIKTSNNTLTTIGKIYVKTAEDTLTSISEAYQVCDDGGGVKALKKVFGHSTEHVHSYTCIESAIADCTTDAYYVYECSCGHTYTEYGESAYGHSYEVTAFEGGYVTYTCSNCGDEYTVYDESVEP